MWYCAYSIPLKFVTVHEKTIKNKTPYFQRKISSDLYRKSSILQALMLVLEIIFWLSIFFLFYSYAGYAIITYILIKMQKVQQPTLVANYTPSVTLLIAAYNEASFIEEKIANTFALDYPKEKLQIVFITDGSNDGTDTIITKYPGITVLHSNERKGKTAALNRAMPFATNEIVVMCDANTILNKDCIKLLVQDYQDANVGGVSGEKRVLSEDGLTKQEGLYWKYESALKKLDAKYYTVVGAAGELFSFRRILWSDVEEDTLLDDFMISMRIVEKGYRILYEPQAYAMETASASVKDEAKRKVRIAAGGFQSINRLLPMLNIFKYGKASFLYISHRVLRWAVCPFCLVLALVLNIVLAIQTQQIIYTYFLAAQLAAYALVLINWLLSKVNLKLPFVQPLQYFVFMNICVIRGLFRYIKGKQAVTWERAERQVITNTDVFKI